MSQSLGGPEHQDLGPFHCPTCWREFRTPLGFSRHRQLCSGWSDPRRRPGHCRICGGEADGIDAERGIEVCHTCHAMGGQR